MCVRVPKNILGMNDRSPFSFFFVLLASLSVSFPEEQEHSVQGPEDCNPEQKKRLTKSHGKMKMLNSAHGLFTKRPLG